MLDKINYDYQEGIKRLKRFVEQGKTGSFELSFDGRNSLYGNSKASLGARSYFVAFQGLNGAKNHDFIEKVKQQTGAVIQGNITDEVQAEKMFNYISDNKKLKGKSEEEIQDIMSALKFIKSENADLFKQLLNKEGMSAKGLKHIILNAQDKESIKCSETFLADDDIDNSFYMFIYPNNHLNDAKQRLEFYELVKGRKSHYGDKYKSVLNTALEYCYLGRSKMLKKLLTDDTIDHANIIPKVIPYCADDGKT